MLMGYEQGCKKITVKNMHNHGSFWKNWENYGKSLCLIFIVILKEKYDKTHTTLSSETLDERHTHTHTFNGPLSRTSRVGRYQKGKTNLDFTEARDSEWQ